MRGGVLTLACVLGFSAPSACSNASDPPTVRRPTREAGPFDASMGPDSAASAGAGGAPDAPGEAGADAGLAPPVRLGITASEAQGDAGAASSDATLAELTVLSAGSRARSLTVRFDQLLDTSGNPNDSAFSGLAEAAALARAHGCALLFSIAVVDRIEDARPVGLRGSWSSPELRARIRALIDRVYLTFGSELAYLSFGTDVDRFLSLASDTDRLTAAAFLYQALSYAKAHAQRLPSTAVGVTFSAAGVIAGLAPESLALLNASDAAIVTDYAIDSSFQAKSVEAALGDLATLDSTLKDSPIVLQELAYPSSELVQSSPDQQKEFYDHVFALLAARRQRFPFVDLYALTDSDDIDAQTRAQSFGMIAAASGDSGAGALAAATAAFGSLGLIARAPSAPSALNTNDAVPKPAWTSALLALSAFKSP